MQTVQIDVWSDYVCPYCYIAEAALMRIAHDFSDTVQITWHAFELRPDPAPVLDPKSQALHDAWSQAVYPLAQQRGLPIRQPSIQPRSRFAHEATAYARSRNLGPVFQNAIFQAFFERSENIGKQDVLAHIGGEVGIEPRWLLDAFRSSSYLQPVLDDEELAEKLGITSIPAIVVRPAGASFEEAVLVQGAQPYEVIAEAVREANRSEKTATE